MSYKQPVYSIATRNVPCLSWPALKRIELVHVAGPKHPSDFTPSWVSHSGNTNPKGAYVYAETQVGGALMITACEWYETDKRRTMSKEVSITLDAKAAWALLEYLNSTIPNYKPS